MKKIALILFILSISLNAAFIIHIMVSKKESPPASTEPVQLNLTEQQKKEMSPIRLKTHRENEAIKQKIARQQELLIAALNAKPVDREKIYLCIDSINILQKKIQRNTIDEILSIRKHMTPEQCKCLADGLGANMKQTAAPCQCAGCCGNLSNRKKDI